MQATTQALVLHGAHDLRIETRPLPPPEPYEVQVAVKTTGLCGSDLHYYHDFRNGDILVREPLTLGHESAGIVTATGSDVKHLSVGDAVALEVGIPCGQSTCEYCSPPTPTTIPPRYNLCPSMRFRSSAKGPLPHAQGTLQTHLNHPATFAHKLPSGLPLDLAALIEPLSVAIHAARRANLAHTPNANVLIFGAGAVGLLCAYIARRNGVRRILIADINPARVQFAVSEGFADAGFTAIPPPPQTPAITTEEQLVLAQSTAEAITATSIPVTSSSSSSSSDEPFGPADLIFECTGATSAVQTSIYAAKAGGKIMLVGMGNPVQTLPISAAALREVDLLGVFRYAATYTEGVRIVWEEWEAEERRMGMGMGMEMEMVVGEGKRQKRGPRLGRLITQRFRGLEGAREAFEMAGRSVDEDGGLVVKVLVEL